MPIVEGRTSKNLLLSSVSTYSLSSIAKIQSCICIIKLLEIWRCRKIILSYEVPYIFLNYGPLRLTEQMTNAK